VRSKPFGGRSLLAKAETRLSARRAFSDRECFDKEEWWRKKTCHRNCGDVDEVADFDARAFWMRKTTRDRNDRKAGELVDLGTRSL
jgi:hypothetical protein